MPYLGPNSHSLKNATLTGLTKNCLKSFICGDLIQRLDPGICPKIFMGWEVNLYIPHFHISELVNMSIRVLSPYYDTHYDRNKMPTQRLRISVFFL